MRESARIYDVRMAQFVLKIEKLSHIIGARGSQDLRSPFPIMAPVNTTFSNSDTIKAQIYLDNPMFQYILFADDTNLFFQHINLNQMLEIANQEITKVSQLFSFQQTSAECQ